VGDVGLAKNVSATVSTGNAHGWGDSGGVSKSGNAIEAKFE
jgi:hypothetical protein